VFCVLGLADPEIYDDMVADYGPSTTATDVYRRATVSVITKTPRLEILGACNGAENSPSWLPAFAAPWRAKPFPFEPDQDRRSGANVSFDEAKRVLTARGQPCGVIHVIHPAQVRSDTPADELEATILA